MIKRSASTTPPAVPRWLAALIAFTLGLAGVVTTVAEAAPAAAAGAGLQVYVGYADNLRADVVDFPTPWSGSSGVTFEGCTGSCTFDAGAVRFVNNSTTPQTISSISVSLSTCTFAMWPDATLAVGQQLIITQTASGAVGGCITNQGYFDTSDIGPNGANWAGDCNQSGVIPVVNATIDGSPESFKDTGQVINTGGVDRASCPPPGGNESTQWSQIGTSCNGATLTLAPATQTHQVGDTAEVDATLANSCGQGLQGSNVDFTIPSGPNAGQTHTAVTDASGVAVFDYASSKAGADTVNASVTNAVGVINAQSPVTVDWVSYLTGRAYGLSASGLASIPATPDTGYVKTDTAENVQPPCVVTVTGLVSAGTLCANVTTSLNPGTSTAKASVQHVGINALGVPAIQIGAVSSSSQTSCSGSTGDTTIASATVGGIPVNVNLHPGPNTTVNVLGVKITFNEQVPVTSTDKGLTVNAVHIDALGLLNVVVASSTSDIAGC